MPLWCAFLWQLAAVQNAQTILLYAAFGSEADLSALAEKAQAQGKTLAYPVCGEAYSLTAAVPGPDGWEMGQYGMHPHPEPVGDSAAGSAGSDPCTLHGF